MHANVEKFALGQPALVQMAAVCTVNLQTDTGIYKTRVVSTLGLLGLLQWCKCKKGVAYSVAAHMLPSQVLSSAVPSAAQLVSTRLP